MNNCIGIINLDENEQKITKELEQIISKNQIEAIQTTPSVMKFHLDNLTNKQNIKSFRKIFSV